MGREPPRDLGRCLVSLLAFVSIALETKAGTHPLLGVLHCQLGNWSGHPTSRVTRTLPYIRCLVRFHGRETRPERIRFLRPWNQGVRVGKASALADVAKSKIQNPSPDL